MNAVRIAAILVVQVFVCLGLALLIANRVQWTQVTTEAARNALTTDGGESVFKSEDGFTIKAPFVIELSSGDLGLDATVLQLAILFTLLLTFRNSLTTGFKIYVSVFLLVVFAIEASLFVHQQWLIPRLYHIWTAATVRQRGQALYTASTDLFTTEHGALIHIPGMEPVRAVVRDPNVIPLVMVSAFLIPWLALQKNNRKKRKPVRNLRTKRQQPKSEPSHS